ncbi:cytochrome c oxidase subunit II [Alienimonas californiensis]|uniref:Cytochrome c oxidase subunit 2 n=1 Tax=Alienimonas californiensis TaxID=2527989 RepID=A0A517PBW6_9PLAN|nr:cytochrome c oxidase subunit II [Alienimonas californiensis]QDT16849.1 Cytochrome c oxidase subunit 2 precursor [Alienimonas californiensis]
MPFLPPLADDSGETFLFPESASTFAENSDSLFWLITWISIVFFAIVVAAMGWFMWRYRHRPVETFSPETPNHNLPLELTWTIIPVLLVIVIFGFGFTGYLDQRTPPVDAYEVRLIAKKWNFLFVYPDANFKSSTLYVPVDRPVRLRMVSQDVLHSFWVPAFRAKWDIVPGRDSIIWFTATKPGEYLYECTEYCGKGHSDMIKEGGVVAVPVEEFEERLREERIKSLVDIGEDPLAGGEAIYKDAGCSACHTVTGVNLNCPTWKDLWGETRQFTDGTSAVADDDYIRESILQPDAHVVKGYQNVMPSYRGQLEEIEIMALTAYIRSVSEKGQAEFEKYLEDVSVEAEKITQGAE